MTRRESPQNILPLSTPLLLYSRVQTAAMLNIGPSTLDRLRNSNPLLRPVRIGNRILWPLKNLVAYVDELIDATESSDPWGAPAA